MLCPFCEQDKDKVIDSRSSEAGRVIRRRRECLACSRRFTTYERVEETVKLTVVKKDGTRVPYDRSKLLSGLEKACYKRAVGAGEIEALVDGVEESLFRSFEKEVPSTEIGRRASDALKSLDRVAYVRYASVYKQFRDVEDFMEELKEVMATAPDAKEQGRLF